MKGVLLINLGSPKSTEVEDVKAYLGEFLMDKHVIDIPYLLRLLLVKGIILNTRPKKSALNYKRIWTDEGSPLVVFTKRLLEKLKTRLEVPVAMAMRYGKPDIHSGLKELNDKGVTEVLIFQLYPQHAMSTTKTVMEKAEELRDKHFHKLKLSFVPAFYNKKSYIETLAAVAEKHLKQFPFDHLLFSYHGLPNRHIRKTDVTKGHCKIDEFCCKTESAAHEFCYRHQCYETTRLVAERLGLDADKFSTSFQSRLKGDTWLKPYTDETVLNMPRNGVKNLAVITPAFVADCLETLDEIAIEAKHRFVEAGGKNFLAIPCLNDDDLWVETVRGWIDDWNL